MGKYIVGITGASGSVYAKRVIERLIQNGHHVCICMTQAGKLVVESELGWQIGQDTPSCQVEQYLQETFGSKELIHHYDIHAIGAPHSQRFVRHGCHDSGPLFHGYIIRHLPWLLPQPFGTGR